MARACWACQRGPGRRFAGANEDIRVAVVGFNGRGDDHINAWEKIKGVRLAALCDVDSKVLDRRRQPRPKTSGTMWRVTPTSENFWPTRILTPFPSPRPIIGTRWPRSGAVQAGKDVYVEKPVSHNVLEGEKMVQAAKHYHKIVQVGTQSRSSYGIKEAVEWVKAGNLGKILVSRALCYKPPPSIGKTTGPQPVPETVDYDLWCGPAPLTPPRRKRFHYDWHWFWDYGAGDVGNQGIHEMDVARWFLGEQTFVAPRAFHRRPARLRGRRPRRPTPSSSFTIICRAPLIMEVRGLPEKTGSKKMDNYKGGSIGIVVECEGGYVVVPDYKSAIAHDKDGKEIKRFEGASQSF